ncbi:MAG: hypothetical protein EOM52_03710 [Clostridia bacterium]|nr:hypothetical protein [Clostridia bacterium]
MKKRKAWVPALAGLAVLLALFSLFRFLYLYDNKYTAPPPYGADGVYAFSEVDLDRPLFLIDGWKLSVDGGEERETFIGQYSNFSYVDGGSAFGEAVYRIALRCPGLHALALDLPEIFTDYTLYLDGAPIASRGSGTLVSFVLRDEAELALHVENRTHYYSGLYYPPALGTAAVIANLSTARMLFYTVLTVAALTLAAFSAVLWAGRSRDRLFLHFGFLCLAFVGTCLYPFLWRWGLNGRLGYAMENTARLLMLFEAVAIAACLADWTDGKAYRRIRPVALALCAACFPCVIFIIPTFDGFINLYGYYSETLFLAGWAALCVCTAGALRRGAVGGAFLAGGCCFLGAGLLANLLNSNRFEPIRGGLAGGVHGLFPGSHLRRPHGEL